MDHIEIRCTLFYLNALSMAILIYMHAYVALEVSQQKESISL